MKKSVLTAIITYLASKIIFNSINFEYNPFVEGMKLEKFVIDFGVWIVVFGTIYIVLGKLSDIVGLKEYLE